VSKRSTLVLTVCLMVGASLAEAVPASAAPPQHAQVGPASATTDAADDTADDGAPDTESD